MSYGAMGTGPRVASGPPSLVVGSAGPPMNGAQGVVKRAPTKIGRAGPAVPHSITAVVVRRPRRSLSLRATDSGAGPDRGRRAPERCPRVGDFRTGGRAKRSRSRHDGLATPAVRPLPGAVGCDLGA